jgi:hypothetical protein
LELGSGTGLLGCIVAGLGAKHVIMTDLPGKLNRKMQSFHSSDCRLQQKTSHIPDGCLSVQMLFCILFSKCLNFELNTIFLAGVCPKLERAAKANCSGRNVSVSIHCNYHQLKHILMIGCLILNSELEFHNHIRWNSFPQ